MSHPTRPRRAALALAAGALLASGLAAAPATAHDRGHRHDPAAKLAKAVTLKGLLEHSRVLQRIADRNDGNRASGLPGYDASAAYVAATMRKAGYRVTVQEFDFPYFEELGSSFAQVTPNPTTYSDGEQYDLMDYSGRRELPARRGAGQHRRAGPADRGRDDLHHPFDV